MALRPCLDCRRPTEGSRCSSCRSTKNRQRDQGRGSAAARGYGGEHQAERRRWAPTVAAGQAVCAELICLEERDGHGRRITPGSEWHLAHDRARPGEYLGPAHARCNESEGARFRAQNARAAENPATRSP